MKRRNFLKTSAAVGLYGLGTAAGSLAKPSVKTQRTTGPGFDVHPFVKEHPEAVFIVRTSVDNKGDANAIRSAGLKLSRELIVKSPSGGFPCRQGLR